MPSKRCNFDDEHTFKKASTGWLLLENNFKEIAISEKFTNMVKL